jgi:putative ABC transport system permease protein
MFKLNLKIALRNLWKYKGYTAINILGLSIGLASCILIFIFIRYQLSYDKDYTNGNRIYRVVSSWKYVGASDFFSQGVPRPLAPAMRNDFSQLEKVAAIQQSEGIIKVHPRAGAAAEIKVSEDVYYAEPSFFEIFDYQWLYGKPNSALSEPNTVVLSEKTANTYFGDWRKALGNSINFDNKRNFKVTGIFRDNPKNSSFPLKIVFSYVSYDDRNSKSWGAVSSGSECYVLLKKGVTVDQLNAPLESFIKKYYVDKAPGKEGHSFQPLNDIHHNADYGNFEGSTTPYKQLIGLGVIGLFLLFTACINFVNLATAQAISRSKEVGVRKVMGSKRAQLIWQFLSETSMITLLALLLACVLTELAIPAMESLLNENSTFSLFGHPIIFVFLLAMLVLVSFLAGLYPAMVMSGFSPVLAIKNKVSAAGVGGVGLRKTLVVVQFVITAILIVSTLVVIQQMSYIRNKSLGFNTEAIAMVSLPTDSLSQLKYNSFKEAILDETGVERVSFCNEAPSSLSSREMNFAYNSSKDADFQVNLKFADDEYFKTFGLKLIAGTPLPKSDTLKGFLVNETLLKKLNVVHPSEALGKIIRLNGHKKPILGVVKDFNNTTLREAISPIVIFSSKNNYRRLAIKLEAKEMAATMKAVEKIFNHTFPNDIYRSRFIDDQLKNYYHTEQVMGVLFKVFSGVVIFISFIGLFGLISFVAAQRTKEIAIRKVLGASHLELIKMLNSTFLWLVLIANMVAWPIAYVFISKWLSNFEYRISLSAWPFAIAMFISMLITLLTVTLRSYKAANANTIDALKYE